MKDALVVSFSNNQWEGPKMNRHQIMKCISRQNMVLFVEPVLPIRESLAELRATSHLKWLSKSLVIFQFPCWLGRIFAYPLIERYFQSMRKLILRRLIAKLRAGRQLIFYFWTPDYVPYLNIFDDCIKCYHIYDDFESYYNLNVDKTGLAELRSNEIAMLMNADVAFGVTRELCNKKSTTKRVHYIPNGVEYLHFNLEDKKQMAQPYELSAIAGPRFGYIGNITPKVDIELLLEIFIKYPKWALIMVGQVHRAVAETDTFQRLDRLSNIHFMGNQNYSDLPRWLKGIDVCLMPYRLDSHAFYGYPLKMLEYFSAGKPVVSSDIPAVREYSTILRIESGVDGWCKGMKESLNENSDLKKDMRLKVAQDNTWQKRVDNIFYCLSEEMNIDQLPKQNAESPQWTAISKS